jgi:hypothetical protein
MVFHIGDREYSVRRRWNLTLDGDRVDAFIDHNNRVIWIDGDLPREEIEITLQHEHLHAWEWRAGASRLIAEDRAQFSSMVMSTFNRDFSAGGGVAGVDSIIVEGLRGSAPSPAKMLPMTFVSYNRTCGGCETEIAAGSIASSQPREAEKGVFVMTRWFRCPICGAVPVWDETCNQTGFPLGSIASGRLLRGDEAAAWEEEHAAEAAPAVWNVV